MGRKNDRSNERESNEMRRTNVQREDRHMSAGARGDHASGNEGIDDPAIQQTSANELNDDLAMESQSAGVGTRTGTGNRMSASDRDNSAEGMRQSSRQHSTRGTDNKRQQGREQTDDNASSFSGQGDQREGAENPEGTGYTN